MDNCNLQSAACLRKPAISKLVSASFSVLTAVILLTLLGVSAVAQNALPLINAPLVPGQKNPGSATFTLTVNGTGFVSGATVNWNGNSRTTTFVSSTQVTASIQSTDVATAGTASVTVVNPAPGGGRSNVAHFQVVKGGYTAAFGKLDFNTDVTPQDVTSADFNGDGKVDLAVPTGNNTVSILLGAGDGTFPTHVEYAVPGHPIGIVAGDFNGDGKIDLVTIAGFLPQISVLLGNGDGTFQAHVEYPTGSHPTAIATADVNRDGKLDLVIADLNDNKVAVLLGNGDGTFQAHVDYATGNSPEGVAIGDFNGDGKLDLAVANNSDGTVAILLGNGDGTFQGPTPFPTAINCNSVVTGDFNGDGKLDLAVGTSNKNLSVLLGNGDGTFQNHVEYAIGANAVLVSSADFNSDGRLDLVAANFNDNTVSVLIGNGDGTFKGQTVFPTGAGPSGLTIADFNNNGKLDIAVAATTANTVSVLTDSAITLSPTILPFGKETSGIVSGAKTVTVKNTGTTTYTVGTQSFIGGSSTDFKVSATTCGTTVAAGATCTYSVTFDPTASEVADAQFILTASNGSVIGVQLTGNGNVPILLNPRNMSFPFQLIGTVSAAKTNSFQNVSGVPITLTVIDLEGTNPDQFVLTHNCPISPNTLAPGATCVSTITYAPTSNGPTNGSANVTEIYYGNFTLLRQGVLISGRPTAVKVSPLTLTFPATTVGTAATAMNVTFQNAGATTMAISSVNFTGANNDFTLISNTCGFPGGSVPANSSCTLSVGFTPSATGTRSATMKIGDPDPTGPQIVTLTGTGK